MKHDNMIEVLEQIGNGILASVAIIGTLFSALVIAAFLGLVIKNEWGELNVPVEEVIVLTIGAALFLFVEAMIYRAYLKDKASEE